jgi:hypothetical protein
MTVFFLLGEISHRADRKNGKKKGPVRTLQRAFCFGKMREMRYISRILRKKQKSKVDIILTISLWTSPDVHKGILQKIYFLIMSSQVLTRSSCVWKKKPLGENFGHSFSFGANIFCQFFTVWTIVYRRVSSINPKLICGRSLEMRRASNNGNKVT